ncbi:MAG: DNA polymerase Y family protein [Novosphingobium sp.]|nr:DNA polymerase Y family protein [Novosphingobium sp.]
MSANPSRRILAIWLARLAIDRWRLAEGLAPGEGADPAPLALIAETAHGPRIVAGNDAALAAGVRAATMLADARALCPALAAVPHDAAGDLAFLESLAVWAQRWGPWSALDPPDGVIVDVTGASHLFGGEAALLGDAAALLARRGLAARLAIAPTAGAAWALAHYGPPNAIVRAEQDLAAALAELPVAALRLDDDVLTVLRRLGLKLLRDLHGVARPALARRFRSRSAPAANPLIRLDQLLGRVPEPLLPVIARDPPLVQRRLLEPIRHRALLDRLVADLAADMARALEARGEGARRLELGLWKVDGEVVVRSLELAAATRDPAHIAELFAGRLDDVDAGFGIELARLRAAWSEPLALAQADFEAAADAHGTSLAALVDRLTVRLGAEAVRRPAPRASHIPERAQRWQRPLAPDGPAQGELAFHTRPLKLLDRPEPIAVLYATPDGMPRRFRWRGKVHEIARAEGPERIAPEWWRERSTVRLRDYYRVEDGAGRRYWIYRAGLAGDGRGGLPEWFLQGLWS